jgi:hypothetical protein
MLMPFHPLRLYQSRKSTCQTRRGGGPERRHESTRGMTRPAGELRLNTFAVYQQLELIVARSLARKELQSPLQTPITVQITLPSRHPPAKLGRMPVRACPLAFGIIGEGHQLHWGRKLLEPTLVF